MRSTAVREAWEFYRDNCPGFKEPMRKEFRRLDEHVASLESENAKLRECLQDLAEHIREDDGFGLDYGWMLDRMRELGVEI